ncbi:MAG: hypothetical protein ACM3O6_05190 [Acidobacteriota bacterium]
MEEARATAERALASTLECKHRVCEAWALRLLGEIAFGGDAPEIETARDYYMRALALAEELGMRPLIGCCHLGRGRILQRESKGEEAHEHLTTAAAVFRAKEMQAWLQQAEAEMRHSA